MAKKKEEARAVPVPVTKVPARKPAKADTPAVPEKATRKPATRAAEKEKPAPKKDAKNTNKNTGLLLSLPKGVTIGSPITCVYSKELSVERGLNVSDDEAYGSFHGIVEVVTKDMLTVCFVYPGGAPPERGQIDLSTGIDSGWGTAVASLQACPIPLAQLKKWQAAGVEAAKAESEEDGEDEDETEEDSEAGGDDDTEESGSGAPDEVDYQ